jgi:hypothetical protein
MGDALSFKVVIQPNDWDLNGKSRVSRFGWAQAVAARVPPTHEKELGRPFMAP